MNGKAALTHIDRISSRVAWASLLLVILFPQEKMESFLALTASICLLPTVLSAELGEHLQPAEKLMIDLQRMWTDRQEMSCTGLIFQENHFQNGKKKYSRESFPSNRLYLFHRLILQQFLKEIRPLLRLNTRKCEISLVFWVLLINCKDFWVLAAHIKKIIQKS